MVSLENKIDFAVLFSVENANPNGDPLSGNRPRVNYDGLGEVSDVAIKRKIRNRFMDLGHEIFVQSDDRRVDEFENLGRRYGAFAQSLEKGDEDEIVRKSCEKWIDVRTFGQLFAFKGSKAKGGGVSIGIRGPVSIHPAFSIDPISVTSTQITKSVSSEGDGTKKSSDTMGMKHRVDAGTYVFYGAISPQLAKRTGFSQEDAEILKSSLLTLFENDASSARPEGSMDVRALYWWQHNSPSGQYSSRRVHSSLKIREGEEASKRGIYENYEISVDELEGLKPEVIVR